eukprot:1232620-Karenia_brevis.AAC.1
MCPEEREELQARGIGCSEEEFLKNWKFNGEVQRARGQLLHYHAEQALNGRMIKEPHSPDFKQAQAVIHNFIYESGLIPFRTEVCLYHKNLQVAAGQADLLCLNKNGELMVCDWKRCRDIRMHNAFRTMKSL